jgi:hypothetical protein
MHDLGSNSARRRSGNFAGSFFFFYVGSIDVQDRKQELPLGY